MRREGDLVRRRAPSWRALRLALGVLLGRDRPVRVTVPDGQPAARRRRRAGDRWWPRRSSARPELARPGAPGRRRRGAGPLRLGARSPPALGVGRRSSPSDVPYPTGEKQGWQATLDLTWPLYDGGLRYGKRREAEARVAAARAAEAAQRLQVSQEARDAARDVGGGGRAAAARRPSSAGWPAEAAGTAAARLRGGHRLLARRGGRQRPALRRRRRAGRGAGPAGRGAGVALERALGRGP
ncbi:MAG: TolC family protein [Comamonadaceae bacterium]|nr:TolC family protein [Comamonadaceae bacterium]